MNSTAWMGQLPRHWAVRRASHILQLSVGGTPPTHRPEYFDGDIPWLTIADMGEREVHSCKQSLTPEGVKAAGIEWSEPGDLLYSFKLSIGKIGIARIRLVTNEAIATIRSTSEIALGFARWVLPLAFESSATRNIYGAEILNRRQLLSTAVPYPPLDEQLRIADYLDRETAEIDALINEQRSLVELLQERLAAEWALRVEHLVAQVGTVELRRVVRSIVDGPFGSSLTSSHYSDEGTRVIRLGNIGLNKFLNSDVAFIPKEYGEQLAAHQILPGDVVVAGLGDSNNPLGRSAVIPPFVQDAIVKADCYRVRPTPAVDAGYLAWVLSSPFCGQQFKTLSRGSTRQRLNTSVVRDVRIPAPPVGVQKQVVLDALNADTATAESIELSAEAIALSRERRAALISAAVTGKIDVTEKHKSAAEQLEDDLAEAR